MHPIETEFERTVGRVVSELAVLIGRRIDQVERDSRILMSKLKASPERAAVVRAEAAGTIDALSWVLMRVEEIQSPSGETGR